MKTGVLLKNYVQPHALAPAVGTAGPAWERLLVGEAAGPQSDQGRAKHACAGHGRATGCGVGRVAPGGQPPPQGRAQGNPGRKQHLVLCLGQRTHRAFFIARISFAQLAG